MVGREPSQYFQPPEGLIEGWGSRARRPVRATLDVIPRALCIRAIETEEGPR
jgi:hypothetical protein